MKNKLHQILISSNTWVYMGVLSILLTAIAFTYAGILAGIVGLYTTALCYLNLKLSQL